MKYDLYDFDGTIYDGDSGIDMIFFAMRKYPKIIPNILINCLLYLLKIIDKNTFKSRVFSFVKYIDNMDDFLASFWQKHEKKIKSYWLDKKSHKNDVIISASCVFWLQPIAKKYKVASLIATEIDMATGEIIGNNCHGEEKVTRFYQEFPKGIISKMYTDSVHDLPLIKEAVDESILVKRNKLYNYFEYKPNFLVRLWRLSWSIYHKKEEMWNYLIVGALTTLVSLSSKWILVNTILNSKDAIQMQIAIITSWIIAVLFAYVTNRFYVFKSKSKNILQEMITFFTARLLTLGMEMIIMYLFVTFLNQNFYVWTILTQIVIMILNYLFSKLIVFKKRIK